MANLQARLGLRAEGAPATAETAAPGHRALPDRASAHRRRRREIAIAILLAAMVAAATAVWRQSTGAPVAVRARVTLATSSTGPVVTLTAGRIDILQLRAELLRRRSGGLLAPVAGGGFQLDATLTVNEGARLDVVATPLFLRSDAHRVARILVNGGRAAFQRDTILSWNDSGAADTNLADGRADIVARGATAQLSFTKSTVAALGANPENPGVSWRDGASGSITGSLFTNNFRGAYAYRAGNLTVQNSRFVHAEENGLLMYAVGPESTVSNSSFDDSLASGLEIDSSRAVRVTNVSAADNAFSGVVLRNDRQLQVNGGTLSANKLYGLVIGASAATAVTALRSFANGTGAQVNDGSCAVDHSFFSGNTQDGILVSTESTSFTMTNSRLDHNEQAGMWVAGGQVNALHNLFDSNHSGVFVHDLTPRVTLRNNAITRSSVDGIGLPSVSAGETIVGNTISDSAKAAFSVPTKADITALKQANTVPAGQPLVRIRGT